MSIETIQKKFGTFKYDDLGNGLITIDKSWMLENLLLKDFPSVGLLKYNKYIEKSLTLVFTEIQKNNLGHLITTTWCGGCFMPRHSMWDRKNSLSTHCYGLSVDLNVKHNPYGRISQSTMSFDKTNITTSKVIAIFERHGFLWGAQKDPSHFEFVNF